MSLELNDKISWVDVGDLKPHPKNTNRHTEEQIIRLAKIIKYQGFRSPIVVSNQSGYIVAGHARLEAALTNGLNKVPVSYQDFEDEKQEYAHMTADNEIARWAELDFHSLKIETQGWDLDPDFFGIQGFDHDKVFEEPEQKSDPKESESKMITCPNCGVIIDG